MGLQAEAIQRALTTLFSRNFLPANPFPLLAEVFSGNNDQSGVWRLTNQQASLLVLCAGVLCGLASRLCLQQVLETVQHGGPVVLSKSPDLASLSQYENAWGLPHVLACVCRKGKTPSITKLLVTIEAVHTATRMSGLLVAAGIDIIRSVVSADLPRSFYPSFRPSDPDNEGYSVEVLPSLQVDILEASFALPKRLASGSGLGSRLQPLNLGQLGPRPFHVQTSVCNLLLNHETLLAHTIQASCAHCFPAAAVQDPAPQPSIATWAAQTHPIHAIQLDGLALLQQG